MKVVRIDSSFLHMDTENQFGHIAGRSIFARPEGQPYDPRTSWKGQLESRLHLLKPLRRRLREVPMGLDHPFWIDDWEFDLDYHVRGKKLSTGSDEEPTDLVAEIIAQPLDRRRPLWETYVIE